jgi:hypothetical protein
MMIEWGGATLSSKVAGSLLGVAMGICELPKTGSVPHPSVSSLACLRMRSSADLVAFPGAGDSPLKVFSFTGSLGVHFSPLVAVQVKGSLRDASSFDTYDDEWALLPEGLKKTADHAVLRLGNPTSHRFRTAIGNQRLPFGIDGSPADDAWLIMEDRIFWGTTSTGISAAYDNLLDLQLEAGISGQGVGQKGESSFGESLRGRTSVRLTHDLGFFERARIVVSAADDLYRMRYGFGFISSLRSGDLTHFELLRSTGSDERLGAGFRRLFRFAYQTSDRRWWFLYDDDRLRARSFALGYRHFFMEQSKSGAGLALKLAFGGVRSLNSTVDGKAMVTSGVEATL